MTFAEDHPVAHRRRLLLRPCILHLAFIDNRGQVRALVKDAMQNLADEDLEGVAHGGLEPISGAGPEGCPGLEEEL